MARLKSRVGGPRALMALAVVAACFAFPSRAAAHGPVAPIASSYLARIRGVPPGMDGQVIDGDQRIWLRVRRGLTVVIVDYRGAPYLRFSPSGIEVNQNSSMYYLNQTPVALTPPANLTASTPPSWHTISSGDTYSWHDGRLHGLAVVALRPGAAYVGPWRIPVLIDGRRAAITGGLWHADDPPIVWFWPIVVLLTCVLAVWRIHARSVDQPLARGLGLAALVGLSAAVLTRQLHGRPAVGVFQLVEIVLVLAFALWAAHRILFVRHGYFLYLVIAIVALWQGAELIPTLLQGFVLAVGPPFVVRTAAVVSLGTGISLLPMVFRLADDRDHPSARAPEHDEFETDDDSAWELA